MPPLKVFEIKEDGDFQFHLENFNSVLDKIQPSNLPICVLSIVGTKRLGKSYLLNCILRQFKVKRPIWQESPSEGFFNSGGGSQRITVGIDVYSEPLIVEEGDKKIALILLDCQGEYDKHTDTHGNNVIMTISHLLSSVMMYNLHMQMAEEILKKFVHVTQYVQDIKTSGNHHSNPNLFFLIRDFPYEQEFGLGISNSDCKPEVTGKQNYYDSIFIRVTNMPEENRIYREALLKTFDHMRICLLPHPGKLFVKNSRCNPDDDFQLEITKLCEHILTNLATKQVNGNDITKTPLKKLLFNLKRLCAENKFPPAANVAELYKKLQEDRRREKLWKTAALVGGVTVAGVGIGACAAVGAAAVGVALITDVIVNVVVGGAVGGSIFASVGAAVSTRSSKFWKKLRNFGRYENINFIGRPGNYAQLLYNSFRIPNRGRRNSG